MNVKKLAELLKEKKYLEFYKGIEEVSPRVLHYIFDYIDYLSTQDDLFNNTSTEQFKKWRLLLAEETVTDYLIKNNLDQYTLSEEEKQQACLMCKTAT